MKIIVFYDHIRFSGINPNKVDQRKLQTSDGSVLVVVYVIHAVAKPD
jgi:hypothetical protein